MENYYFDERGVYTGSAPAHENSFPPENALRLAPQEQPGYWPVLNPTADGWDMVEDHRGERGWVDGVPAEILDIGPYPDAWSFEPPAPQMPDDQAEIDPGFLEKLAALLGDRLANQAHTRFLLNSTGATYHTLDCVKANTGSLKTLAEIAAARPDAKPCPACNPPALPVAETVGE